MTKDTMIYLWRTCLLEVRIDPDQKVLGPFGQNVPIGHLQEACVIFLDSNGRQRKSPSTVWLTVVEEKWRGLFSIWLSKKQKKTRKTYINLQKNFLEFIALLLMKNILLNKDQWKDIKMNKRSRCTTFMSIIPYAHTGCSSACSLSSISLCTFTFPISSLKYIHPMELKQMS